MSIDEGIHLANESINLPEAVLRSAALQVCGRATSTDDAENLLQALGLIDYLDERLGP
jgi:hypothetical protein